MSDTTIAEKPKKRPRGRPRKKSQTPKVKAPAPPPEPIRVNIVLRRALPRDLTVIYGCLLGYFNERQHAFPLPNEADAFDWAMNILRNGAIVLAEADGKIIGSVACRLASFPWNSASRYLHGEWLWVSPDFRGGGTGTRLVKAVQDIARDNKLSVIMGAIWGFDPEVLEKLKTDLGFSHAGSNYIWMPPPA